MDGKIKEKFLTVSYKELEERKSQYASYISNLKDIFSSFSKDTPLTVSFVDKDGVVLFTVGNSEDSTIFEGLVFDERLGNTAIGKALQTGVPCEVKGREHTNPKFFEWSCSAVPIYEKDNLIGVIGVSTRLQDYPPFTIELAKLIASSVTKQVLLDSALKEMNISKKFIQVFAEGNKDGVLILDKNANVVYINSVGASILRINQQEAIGRNVTEIVDFTPVILEVFRTHKGYIDREFIIESPSRGTLHFIKTAVVLRDENGEFAGVVDFFKEIEKVRKFVTSFIGAEARFTFEDIKGRSQKFVEAMRIAKIAAHSNASVLITGETGTGKEMFAQAIHFESARNKGPFVAINCSAIPQELAESEFFGYEGGSFTDADRKGRTGKFELANGGTLFLDEVGDLPLSLQPKILRALEDKVITRVGGTKSIKIDVRVIAATNKNLEELVNQNLFRRDLYYRLNVIQINIPPLRERKEDIEVLAMHFLERLSKSLGKEVKGYDKSFIEPLLNYSFPGNVRELQNIIERAIITADSDTLTAQHLPKEIFKQENPDLNFPDYSFDEMRKNLVIKVLFETNFNITNASKKLGISRPTLYKLIRKYNINITQHL
ncbi:sigma-54-dependent Fis family transcriptional regulator [Caldisericum exile]|uniref:Transcriptional regulator AcoR n=1 Tax=Caldisericum exile (strain DSM 21853 / NBRC 104410 / AZM16c01) TaxID=511051 RepID=A0A7U6GDA2_CALEA|nr:sigma-54-dependent Fis family transcriptional regulator [Caldisericum exile]BAL80297.1 putative transcriptional regulator AcoR [Caldisericum exile AZM16c01]